MWPCFFPRLGLLGYILSKEKHLLPKHQALTKDVSLAGFWGILDDAWCADPNAGTDGDSDDDDGSSSAGSPSSPAGSPAVGPAPEPCPPPVLAPEDGVVSDQREDVGVAAGTSERDGHDLRVPEPDDVGVAAASHPDAQDLRVAEPDDVGVAAASHPDGQDLRVAKPELPHPPCDIFGRPVASPASAGASSDAHADMQAKVLAKFESLKTGVAKQLFL